MRDDMKEQWYLISYLGDQRGVPGVGQEFEDFHRRTLLKGRQLYLLSRVVHRNAPLSTRFEDRLLCWQSSSSPSWLYLPMRGLMPETSTNGMRRVGPSRLSGSNTRSFELTVRNPIHLTRPCSSGWLLSSTWQPIRLSVNRMRKSTSLIPVYAVHQNHTSSTRWPITRGGGGEKEERESLLVVGTMALLTPLLLLFISVVRFCFPFASHAKTKKKAPR